MPRKQNPDRARLSAEAKAAKRAEERVVRPAEEAFAQPPESPLAEVQGYKVKPEVHPVDWEKVPDPDDPAFPYSRKTAPYNPFSPPILRSEIRRRALEADQAKYLEGIPEGSEAWVKLSLVLEAKHGNKALYRIRALEILGRINGMYTEKLEIKGAMTPEQQQLAAQRAVENFLAKVGPNLKLLPASAEIVIDAEEG